jgi:RsmE family RNA methyltransferase
MGVGTVISTTTSVTELDVNLTVDPPEPLPLTLILALPRPKHLKRIIQGIAAAGIKHLYLISSWRVEKSYWGSPVLNESTLCRHLKLGLEQAGDTRMPTITQRRRFRPFVEDEIPKLVENSLAVVAHPYNSSDNVPVDAHQHITLAVGPEGGFIPFELDLMRKQGFLAISLGQRILRVEQAIPALIGKLCL